MNLSAYVKQMVGMQWIGNNQSLLFKFELSGNSVVWAFGQWRLIM